MVPCPGQGEERGEGGVTQSSSEEKPQESGASTKLERFLLAEYDHISQAHFSTVASISHFFQYYLIIASLPISLLAVLFRLLPTEGEKAGAFAPYATPLALFSSVVGVVGLLVLGYMTNLRLDAILYARSVNGVRDYFYSRSDTPESVKSSIRMLPTSTRLPKYWEPSYFGFVVGALALVDTVYFCGGWYLRDTHVTSRDTLLLAGIAAVFISIHFCMYVVLSSGRNRYLQRNTVGVDLDGVLNNQVECFCSTLSQASGKPVRPEQILSLPVRDLPGFDISDEFAVFHQRRYWTSLQVMPGAREAIKELRRAGYRIAIYTCRPWPAWRKVTVGHGREKLLESWAEHAKNGPILARLAFNCGFAGHAFRSAMDRLTRCWIRDQEIECDDLVLGRALHGSRARFRDANNGAFRFFVEDDLVNAVQLARACDAVFLVSQPYNKNPGFSLPERVIRVESWAEISAQIRSRG